MNRGDTRDQEGSMRGKECNGCPHGPYEYRVHREGKDLKWEYIGPVEGES